MIYLAFLRSLHTVGFQLPHGIFLHQMIASLQRSLASLHLVFYLLTIRHVKSLQDFSR